MGMPAITGEWTAEMVRALPDDGNRYEVVDGTLLVTPAPRPPHQAVAAELFDLLRQYLKAQQIGQALFSPADIELDARTLVQPDLFVYPKELGKPRDWSEVTRLLLAIEILSPSTARYDRQVKRRRYQRQGVPEYWIVDLDAQLFERWRPGDDRPEILRTQIEWHPAGASAPFTLDLPAYFARVVGATSR